MDTGLVTRAVCAAWLAAAVWAPATARADTSTAGRCVDQEIADRLAVKRQRRGHRDTLFVKQQRHELSIGGGYYVSDLYSATYVAGVAYTFHMTEQTAVELSASMTHADAELIRAIEDLRGRTIDETFARVWLGESLLIWSPIHGKFRFGGSILHFDIHVDAGVGVVDAQTSRGITGTGGVGFKVFLGRAAALRIDVRDHVFQQELLDETFLVNDLSATAGLSLFLPMRN
ncbi:MAG: outer membrane beta-barrel domain-containing protein [Deltaproteobacteria bacterium]|nr:MAG: outer membrane beta-barrel domain-containing protein [Deltaproteobacteria bacterium]